MKILPYSMASESAKSLARALNVKRVRARGRPLRVRGDLICWGNVANILGERDIFCTGRMLNMDVTRASNKLKALTTLNEAGVSVPEFWTNPEEIQEGTRVFARTLLHSHSGQGIIPFTKDENEPPVAPLYTKYIPKKQEYRVHVFDGNVIDVQRKARRSDVPDEEVNWQIRNHSNGFIYAREGVELPDNAKNTCISAINALELDFGAVDLIWNERKDKYYVLEVNTSPGLTGTTLEKYVEIIGDSLC